MDKQIVIISEMIVESKTLFLLHRIITSTVMHTLGSNTVLVLSF